MEAAMASLRDLVVEQHMFDVAIRVNFIPSGTRLTEANVRAISSELDQHLVDAFAKRNMTVLSVEQYEIVVQ
jgi:hypothetical protein